MAAAPDFQQFITNARERKRNEALANAIFSRGRRQSAPSSLKNSHATSFASRVGVNKRGSSGHWSNKRAAAPSGNVDGEWTHDLHGTLDHRRSTPDARASRSAAHGAAASQRRSRLAAAVEKMDIDEVNVVRSSRPVDRGMSIKGLAGPFAVIGENFAPGTTAADIESAVAPVGGDMLSCRVLQTTPVLMAEMVFASREGAERVIEKFDNQTADGRVLGVYLKVDGHPKPQAGPASGSRAVEQVIDGTQGFSRDRDLVGPESRSSSRSSRPLYSDKIVARGRRGRGYHGGR